MESGLKKKQTGFLLELELKENGTEFLLGSGSEKNLDGISQKIWIGATWTGFPLETGSGNNRDLISP